MPLDTVWGASLSLVFACPIPALAKQVPAEPEQRYLLVLEGFLEGPRQGSFHSPLGTILTRQYNVRLGES